MVPEGWIMSLGEWHVWHGHRDGMVQRLKDERTGRIRESSNKPYLIYFGISTAPNLRQKGVLPILLFKPSPGVVWEWARAMCQVNASDCFRCGKIQNFRLYVTVFALRWSKESLGSFQKKRPWSYQHSSSAAWQQSLIWCFFLYFEVVRFFSDISWTSWLYLATVRRLEMSRRSFKASHEVTRPSSSWF